MFAIAEAPGTSLRTYPAIRLCCSGVSTYTPHGYNVVEELVWLNGYIRIISFDTRAVRDIQGGGARIPEVNAHVLNLTTFQLTMELKFMFCPPPCQWQCSESHCSSISILVSYA
jgi:hypothetical protein